MKRYEIEVFIDGKPTYMLYIVSANPERAARRAVVHTMVMHRQMDMDRITANPTGKSEEL